MEHLTHSAAETEALGCRLGCALAPGTVVAYRGGLGMGKTAFTRGLARGLDCRDRVTSPTFTIVNEYQGRMGGLSGPGRRVRRGVERERGRGPAGGHRVGGPPPTGG